MVFITANTWRKNVVEVIIVDNTKWLNEKHIEKQLGRSTFQKTTKYSLELRKQRQDLIKNWFKQPCRRFLKENLALYLIMDCRTIKSVEFRKSLGFNQYDPIMTQEQSILTKLENYFATENKPYQHYVLGYRIDLYIPKYKLATEVRS